MKLYYSFLNSITDLPFMQHKYKSKSTGLLMENKGFFPLQTRSVFLAYSDTGWLLFSKLDREEAERCRTGGKRDSCIRVSVLHNIGVR
jgi:hypothetical protein